jgi:hypothetical protein
LVAKSQFVRRENMERVVNVTEARRGLAEKAHRRGRLPTQASAQKAGIRLECRAAFEPIEVCG